MTAAALGALLVAVPAASAAPRYAGSAAATITSCSGAAMTVAASVRSINARSRRPARIRGTRLQLRLDAVPMFGFPRPGKWQDARNGAATHHAFAGLGADAWTAVVRYRFRRGSRTVISGVRRSESRRVGRARGRAVCILPEGSKPLDTRAPDLFVTPGDGLWRRGPVAVTIAASDDFSGVAQVAYRLDGGETQTIRNGGTFEIAAEGAHLLEVTATDAAGNRAPVRQVEVRVDSGPPTAPVLDLPHNPTVDTTPPIRWSAATDSGSGVQGYFVSVQRVSDGAVVATQTVGPETTSIDSPVGLDHGQSYRAVVTAFDWTNPAWTTGSAPREFLVDTTPEVAGVTPANGTILTGSLKSSNFVLTLDRPAQSSTVNDTNVRLERGGAPKAATVTCNSPCTEITIDPDEDPLEEGRYSILVSGVATAEGGSFAPFDSSYRVPDFESGFDTCAFGGWECQNWSFDAAASSALGPCRPAGLSGTANATATLTEALPDAGDTWHAIVTYHAIENDGTNATIDADDAATTNVAEGARTEVLPFTTANSIASITFSALDMPVTGNLSSDCNSTTSHGGLYVDSIVIVRAG